MGVISEKGLPPSDQRVKQLEGSLKGKMAVLSSGRSP